jgi:hypothetical protein
VREISDHRRPSTLEALREAALGGTAPGRPLLEAALGGTALGGRSGASRRAQERERLWGRKIRTLYGFPHSFPGTDVEVGGVTGGDQEAQDSRAGPRIWGKTGGGGWADETGLQVSVVAHGFLPRLAYALSPCISIL